MINQEILWTVAIAIFIITPIVIYNVKIINGRPQLRIKEKREKGYANFTLQKRVTIGGWIDVYTYQTLEEAEEKKREILGDYNYGVVYHK